MILRLPITTAGHEDEDLLVWTTTPWTLSSNVAAAVHPDLTYVLVEGRDGRRWWVSHGSKPRVARTPRSSARRRARAGRAHLPRPIRRAAGGGRRRAPRHPWDEVDDAEGTGIVHIAPGCGQEDFALSKAFDLPVIDPIDEFGVFVDGFGWQTGPLAGVDRRPRRARPGAGRAADLERQGLLVATERYTHSYPHCWRCGTQLIFRLVDEWFIAMDPLREPVSRLDAARHVAAAGDRPGGARARLAPEHGRLDDQQEALLRPGAADLGVRRLRRGEVIGSKEELRERAVAGWDAFDGHTPHRPWVDAVEIACSSCGARPQRDTTDVGNPWLDAGIVGLSTLKWNSDRDYWREWYPGRLGQRVVPRAVPQLVLRPAHDVDGDDRPGAVPDALRLRADARRARRGDAQEQGQRDLVRRCRRADRLRRHALDVLGHEPVDEPQLRVRAGPRGRPPLLPAAVEHVRLLRDLRAARRMDAGPDRWRRPPARTILDRWILSRLDGLVGEVRGALDAYDSMRAARAIEGFVDELSNWYVRRNRRRFWKGELDADKRAAYATLHEVLTTLGAARADDPARRRCDLGEPGCRRRPSQPDSVHLTDMPRRTLAARRRPRGRGRSRPTNVALGRTARAASGIRTRQPLRARVKLPASAPVPCRPTPRSPRPLTARSPTSSTSARWSRSATSPEMVERSLYPLLPVVGPRHGKAVGAIMAGARSGEWRFATTARSRWEVSSSSPTSSGSPPGPDRDTRSPRRATCSSRSTRPRRGARRGGPGPRGRAPAPGPAPDRRLRDQRPRAVAIGGDPGAVIGWPASATGWRTRSSPSSWSWRRRHAGRCRPARVGEPTGVWHSSRARPAAARPGRVGGERRQDRDASRAAARAGGTALVLTRRTRPRRPSWSPRSSGGVLQHPRRLRVHLVRPEQRGRVQPLPGRVLAVRPGHRRRAGDDRLLLPRLPRPRAGPAHRARHDPRRHARQPTDRLRLGYVVDFISVGIGQWRSRPSTSPTRRRGRHRAARRLPHVRRQAATPGEAAA